MVKFLIWVFVFAGMENTSKQFGVEDEKEKTADSEEHWWGG